MDATRNVYKVGFPNIYMLFTIIHYILTNINIVLVKNAIGLLKARQALS